MKTAMQDIAELLVSRMEGADDELKNKLNFFHSWVVIHGLKKEEQQIINAHLKGSIHVLEVLAEFSPLFKSDEIFNDMEDAQEYYNKNYK